MDTFPTLNLPSFEGRYKPSPSGRPLVFDGQRRRYVTLTAEEWVRQHFVHYLIDTLGYPPALIGNEVALDVGGVTRRCDTVVYSPLDGHPLMIVEYKAPTVAVTQKVFEQIQGYNAVLHADYLIVSNGLRHFCCRNDYATLTANFLPEIPHWRDVNPAASSPASSR